MLQITISEKPDTEYFNEKTGEFIQQKGHAAFKLQLEHSLISLSKWESKWKKPFLNENTKMGKEELIDYVRCMTINGNVEPEAYEYISLDELKQIQDYIADPHTASTIRDRRKKSPQKEMITSELIYYWMIACGIPSAYEKWHLNRLLTLIKICNAKEGPQKQMGKQSIYAEYRNINEMNKKKFGIPG